MIGSEAENTGKSPTTGMILLYIVTIFAIFLLTLWVFQLTWNASIPKMFSGAKTISFATAFFFLIMIMIAIPRKYIIV